MFEGRNRELALVVTLGIAVMFAALDFWTPMIGIHFDHGGAEWIFSLFVGACFAEVTLIAIWGVFASTSIAIRIPTTISVCLLMWYMLVAGTLNATGSHNESDYISLGIVLLLAVLIMQLVLWFVRRHFRYRVLAPGASPVAIREERFQFRLQHLFIGTFVLALGLAPIRYFLPANGLNVTPPPAEAFAVIPIAIAAILLANLPCIWAGFLSESIRWQNMPPAICLALYCLLLTCLEFGALFAIIGRPSLSSQIGEFLGTLYVLNLSQAGTLFTVSRIYYSLGYRLQRVPREVRPAREMMP